MTIHLKTVRSHTPEALSKNIHKKKFIFLKRVYLSDTNIQGSVYFAHFFDWQGMAREEFFRVAVPIHEAFFSAGYQLITAEAAMEYKSEAKLYDEIEISVTVRWIKKASAELSFTFVQKETGRLLAVGKQVIACANKEGKIVAAPEVIKNLLLPYCR
jgi:enediyne core biosynthesis thioesterase